MNIEPIGMFIIFLLSLWFLIKYSDYIDKKDAEKFYNDQFLRFKNEHK